PSTRSPSTLRQAQDAGPSGPRRRTHELSCSGGMPQIRNSSTPRTPSGVKASQRAGLALVLHQLDLVFDLELLSLYVVDQVLVGHRPVDFFLQGQFQALMPGSKGFDTILQRHAAPPWIRRALPHGPPVEARDQ